MARFSTPVITPKRVKNPPKAAAPSTSAAAAKPLKAPVLSRAKPNTTNIAGGDAYKLSLRSEIVTRVLNSMLKGGFYKDADSELAHVQDLVEKADKAGDLEFLAKTALYARHVHGLRTVTHVIAGELGDRARGAEWKRKFYFNIVGRPDDLCEVLAYWNLRHKDFRHPNAMVRGFGERLATFDAYRLAKYKGDGKEVSMIDAVNICHPKTPKTHPIHKLMKGTLEAAETWEAALSKAGNVDAESPEDKAEAVADAKGDAWVKLLKDKKLGYLAALRNLRNIAEQAPQAADDVVALLINEKAIAKAKVFPFQYRTAYQTIKDSAIDNKLKYLFVGAIAKAADIALSNVPVFDGKTLVVVDDSGSMTSKHDAHDRPVIEIASIFAAALIKANPGADYMQFSATARYMDPDRVGLGVFALAQAIQATCQSSSTHMHEVFKVAKTDYDRIIILSDEQGYGGQSQQEFVAYSKRHGHVPYLYSFDLAGHGTSQFPEKQVCLLVGFSDRIFDTMAQVERDPQALVNEIAAIDIAKGVQRNG